MHISKNSSTCATAFSILLSVFILTLLIGCSESKPSESLARKLIAQKVHDQSQGKIRLVSLKKTNGIDRKEYYLMQCDATVEFLAKGSWVRPQPNVNISFEFSNDQIPNDAYGGVMVAMGKENVIAGQRATFGATMSFMKTENGWVEAP